jgi:5'-3' exonuclease
MRNFLLVDFYNLANRCKHTARGDAHTKAGMGLHTILSSIRKAWRSFNGDHVVVCLEGRSWRKSIYPEYKAHRIVKENLKTTREREEDDYFFSTMDELVKFFESKTNITVLKQNPLEADDWIAGWIANHPDDNNIIISTDSDFVQLLSSNVIIYDGVRDLTLTTEGVYDDKSRKLEFSLKSDSKLSIGDPNPDFEPEANWWQKALFFKIIRGDKGDNIMSAYPGVRENSVNKPSLQSAYEDRTAKGFNWNNLMMQTWKDHLGETRKVSDCYALNKVLIDLTAQPEEIKTLMAEKIKEAVNREPRRQVGIWLMRFCDEHQLVNIGKNVKEYSDYMSKPYNKETLT